MPSKSSRQERFMRAVANDPAFARKVGVSQAVGKEFEAADEAKDRAKSRPAKLYGKRQ